MVLSKLVDKVSLGRCQCLLKHEFRKPVQSDQTDDVDFIAHTANAMIMSIEILYSLRNTSLVLATTAKLFENFSLQIGKIRIAIALTKV